VHGKQPTLVGAQATFFGSGHDEPSAPQPHTEVSARLHFERQPQLAGFALTHYVAAAAHVLGGKHERLSHTHPSELT